MKAGAAALLLFATFSLPAAPNDREVVAEMCARRHPGNYASQSACEESELQPYRELQRWAETYNRPARASDADVAQEILGQCKARSQRQRALQSLSMLWMCVRDQTTAAREIGKLQ